MNQHEVGTKLNAQIAKLKALLGLMVVILAQSCSDPRDIFIQTPEGVEWISILDVVSLDVPINAQSLVKGSPLDPTVGATTHRLDRDVVVIGYMASQIDADADLLKTIPIRLLRENERCCALPDPVWKASISRSGEVTNNAELSLPPMTADWVPAPRWTLVTPASQPTARSHLAMTYDMDRERVVIFGGYYHRGRYAELLRDTWEYDGATWIESAPASASSPPARSRCALAYDSGRQRVVLFGGHEQLSDTWEYFDSTWHPVITATAPSWREEHAMAYDARRQKTVLFGGTNTTAFFGDTWEYDGSAWVEANPPTAPRFRSGHAMTYDTSRERIVLYGGYDGREYLGDTWEYDGDTWVEIATEKSIGGRRLHSMTYDSDRKRVVLFGGADTLDHSQEDTWEYDGNTWIETTPDPSPSARCCTGLAYDAARKKAVLFGGIFLATHHNDTWEYDFEIPVQ